MRHLVIPPSTPSSTRFPSSCNDRRYETCKLPPQPGRSTTFCRRGWPQRIAKHWSPIRRFDRGTDRSTLDHRRAQLPERHTWQRPSAEPELFCRNPSSKQPHRLDSPEQIPQLPYLRGCEIAWLSGEDWFLPKT